jgi:ABC-2 type transport system ATP-binding protein
MCRGHRDQADRHALLDKLGLAKITDRLCRELSFGMRQRVGLAAALLGDVEVVLLDETLNGLDPRAAVSARNALVESAEAGAGVLMSTHLLGVAERLCHRIVIMDRGQIRVDVSGDELEALLDKGPGALEALYLEKVLSGEAA